MTLPTKFEPSEHYDDATSPVEAPEPLTREQVEQKAKTQWANHQRFEAMETVLGRPIYKDDLDNDPDLANVFLIDDPEKAYAGLLLVKTLEQMK